MSNKIHFNPTIGGHIVGGQEANLVTITITYDKREHAISVRENVKDEILFYGMIEKARLLYMSKVNAAKNPAPVKLPEPMMLP